MTLILSGTDGLSDVDGSAATPAIRGTDTNTGIFFPAADTIAFSEGGVESMRLDSSGNLGIGTASPAVKLDVVGAINATGAIRANGVTTDIYPLVSDTAKASTSGTNIDFTGIPSWVKRITVMFNGVSTNGTSGYLVRLGTSSGVVSTGYISTSVTLDSSGNSAGQTGTVGFNWYNDNATYAHYGCMTLVFVSSNNWVANHTGRLSTTNIVSGGGGLSLGDTLDRVRITTVNGTDTFDAGSINILYE